MTQFRQNVLSAILILATNFPLFIENSANLPQKNTRRDRYDCMKNQCFGSFNPPILPSWIKKAEHLVVFANQYLQWNNDPEA